MSAIDPTVPAEQGYQAERTVLAHWRTQLASFAVAALLILRTAPGTERWVVCPAAVLAVALVAGAGLRRQRHLLAGRTQAELLTIHMVTAAIALLQAAGLVLVL